MAYGRSAYRDTAKKQGILAVESLASGMKLFVGAVVGIVAIVGGVVGVAAIAPRYQVTQGLFAVATSETTWSEECVKIRIFAVKWGAIWYDETAVDMGECDRPDVWVTQPVRELRKECPEKKGCTGKFQKLLWSTKNRPPKEGG